MYQTLKDYISYCSLPNPKGGSISLLVELQKSHCFKNLMNKLLQLNTTETRGLRAPWLPALMLVHRTNANNVSSTKGTLHVCHYSEYQGRELDLTQSGYYR